VEVCRIEGDVPDNGEASTVVFNLGNHDVKVGDEDILVLGKTSGSWGKEVVLNRRTATAQLEVASARPLYLVYASYLLYTLGFLLIFVEDGISASTQIALFAIAALILLLPLLLYFALPLKLFVAMVAIFYILVFTLPGFSQLEMMMEMIKEVVGEGYVESFVMGAGMLPILLYVMVSQTIVEYRLRIRDGDQSFELASRGLPAKRLVDYLERGQLPRDWTDAFRRLLEFRVPLFFLRLSHHRMKRCQYCGKNTLMECTRCHAPICSDHAGILRGYKVCLDCYKEGRGRLRRQPGWLR